MSPFVRFARAFALCLAPMLVAHAQVDPRLMGEKGSFKTDFLDMLQRATDLKVKPEILTLMDFSGSMGFLSFHKEFTNWEDHENASSSGNHFNIRVTANANDTVSITLVTIGGAARNSFNMGTIYPGKGLTGTMNVTGIRLVNPAGETVTAAKAEECKTATWTRYPDQDPTGFQWVDHGHGKLNAVNWVRAASHARMSFSMTGQPTREIDIPLAWASVLQDPTNTTAPLKRVLVSDPTDTAAPQYEVDTTFLDNPSQVGGGRTSDLSWSLGTSARPNNATVGNYFCYLRLDYLYWMYMAKNGGNYIVPDAATQKDGYPFNNGLPTVTRLQSLKEAVMRTWLSYQDRVFWAYRTLRENEGGPSSADVTNDAVVIPTDNNTAPSRTWISMNNGKRSKTGGTNKFDRGIVRFSKLQAAQATFLNAGLLNSFSQVTSASDNHLWVKALDPNEKPYECSGTFVIVLTDGVPSDEPGTLLFPYFGSSNPVDGNKLVIADADPNLTGRPRSNCVSGGKWYNLPTIAAIGAHAGNLIYGSPGVNYIYSPNVNNTYPGITRTAYPTGSSSMSAYLPYTVVQRGPTKFKQPRPIQTMTVGMSLGDAYSASPWNGGTKLSLTDTNAREAPKFRLVAAAHYGDPDRTKFDLSKAGTYDESKAMPYDLPNGKTAPPTCYFDAADPDSLVTNLAKAFDEILSRVDKGSSAAPVVPYSGLGLGAQVYLASFIPEELGPIWTGDLRMYGTLTDGTSIKILDATGTEITGDLLKAAPMWSAASYLNGLPYKDRKVYTRLPNASSLVRFDPFDAAGMTALSPHFATKDMSGATLAPVLSAAQKKDIARYLIGSSLDQDDANRLGVMGDVIDSSISVVEYDATKLNTANLSSALSTLLAKSGAKFRTIYVGTNTGFLHCFGEVSYPELVTVGTRKFNITRGAIQELWSFIPTDFLAQIQFLKDPAQSHRHLVDGTSVVHHLDLPASGERNPDGKVNPDNDDVTNLERAVLVFGLGKGGRSYYALNIRDPFTPVFAWTVNPDEAATAAGQSVILGAKDPKGIALANLASDIQKMGFATSKPAVGRVLFPHATENAAYQFRDVCFLGGGLSSPELEEKFKTGATAPAMGRLVLGVDVYTGKYMASYDLMSLSGAGTDKTKIDCVPAGVIPFEFFLGTGLTQRLYFADYRRGLWSIGSGLVNDKDASNNDHPFKGFRRDVSQMDLWKKPSATTPYLRKVFTAPDKDYFSLLPAPFLVGTYPVPRGTAPLVTPAVTGIALSSGTKHNPMDRFYTAATLPSHRLYMLFDRQDGPKEGLTDTQGILTTKLFNVTSTTEDTRVDPTRLDPDKFSPVYFLAPTTKGGPTPYYGYTLDFPGSYDPTTAIPDVLKLVPKALTEPVVLVGTLFYSYFKPGADYDPCTGGTGDTNSFRVCDVFSPKLAADASTVVNASPAKYCETGKVFAWNGLSTQFVARGTQASTQAGLVNVASGAGGATTTTTVQIKTATTKQAEQWPRVRTWRSVYDY